NVGDTSLPDDGRDVVFAMTLETNVAQNHHLVIAVDLFERLLQDLGGILAIAGKELLHRANDPRRRFDQAFAAGLIGRPADDGADCGLDLGPLRLAVAIKALQRLQRLQGLQGLQGVDSAVHSSSPLAGLLLRAWTRSFRSYVSR